MENAVIAFAALACPVGMGLMMWYMARGMRSEKRGVGSEIERLEGGSGRKSADVAESRR